MIMSLSVPAEQSPYNIYRAIGCERDEQCSYVLSRTVETVAFIIIVRALDTVTGEREIEE